MDVSRPKQTSSLLAANKLSYMEKTWKMQSGTEMSFTVFMACSNNTITKTNISIKYTGKYNDKICLCFRNPHTVN